MHAYIAIFFLFSVRLVGMGSDENVPVAQILSSNSLDENGFSKIRVEHFIKENPSLIWRLSLKYCNSITYKAHKNPVLRIYIDDNNKSIVSLDSKVTLLWKIDSKESTKIKIPTINCSLALPFLNCCSLKTLYTIDLDNKTSQTVEFPYPLVKSAINNDYMLYYEEGRLKKYTISENKDDLITYPFDKTKPTQNVFIIMEREGKYVVYHQSNCFTIQDIVKNTIYSFDAKVELPTSCEFCNENYGILYERTSKTLYFIDLTDKSVKPFIFDIPINYATISKDGQQIAVGFKDGSIELLLITETNTQVLSFSNHNCAVTSLKFSKDNSILAIGYDNGFIYIAELTKICEELTPQTIALLNFFEAKKTNPNNAIHSNINYQALSLKLREIIYKEYGYRIPKKARGCT